MYDNITIKVKVKNDWWSESESESDLASQTQWNIFKISVEMFLKQYM